MKEQSLQKFTQSESRVAKLFQQKKITIEDCEDFNKDDFEELNAELQNRFNTLEGLELDAFIQQIDEINTVETKNQIWENNHSGIIQAISILINENNYFPSVSMIAKKVKLSRATVHKHLNTFKKHPSYKLQQDSIQMMADKIVWKMYNLANKGDVKAGRLFLEVAGNIGKHKQQNNIQNNFIQINGMRLDQQTILNMNPDQLRVIEDALKSTIDISPLSNPETSPNAFVGYSE